MINRWFLKPYICAKAKIKKKGLLPGNFMEMDLKQKLFDACVAYANERIATAEAALRQAYEAAENETKSSAGDKYETGRAMAQLEAEKAMRQVAEAKKLLQVLHSFNPRKPHTVAALGSLVAAEESTYYLAVSIGQLTIDGKPIFVISPASPAGQALLGKKVGEEFEFAGRRQKISALT